MLRVLEFLPFLALVLEYGFGWRSGFKVNKVIQKEMNERTPNNPRASRSTLSQAAISRRISSRLKYLFNHGRFVCFTMKR